MDGSSSPFYTRPMGARRALGAIGALMVLAACSGSGNVAATKTQPGTFVTQSPTPTPSHVAPSDTARAHALVLNDDDLGPDWLGDSPGDGQIGDPTALFKDISGEGSACVKAIGTMPHESASFVGDYFNLAYGNSSSLAMSTVGSEAKLFKSAAEARRVISLGTDPRAIACANRLINSAFQAIFSKLGVGGVRIANAAFRLVRVSSAADQSAALLFSTNFSYAGEGGSVYLKLIQLRVGRDVVTVFFEDIGSAFPATTERALIRKAVAHLKADGGR